ncbi:aminopeptidase [Candidatus Woesearchaeota archaeon]|nr:aminopeptidase [Candidatus Woesearchaeota archaeon]
MIIPQLNYRAKNLAKTVIDYSTEVKAGEVVKIVGELVAWEFMQELARQVVDKGAHPTIQILNPELEKYLLEQGKEEQYGHVFEHEITRAEESDVHIRVLASENNQYLRDIDTAKLILRKNSRQGLFKIVNSWGKRTNTVIFPTEAGASSNNLSKRDYEQLIYSATEVNWTAISSYLQNIKHILDGASEVRIEVPGSTDLRFSLEGRGGCIDDGHINLPGGEVFYGPVEVSVEGFITFPYSQFQNGYQIGGIRFEYKEGNLIN